jgi:bis(5'-nucleosidyl)-tetraphosphatase
VGGERRAAGILLYRMGPDGPRFLLLRHRGGGHWSPPKGHLEAGERDLEAALRETREECGLAPGAVDAAFRAEVRYEVETKSGRRAPKTVAYFLAEAPAGEVRLSDEHVDHRWADLEEVRALVPFENLVRAFEAADARARERRRS